MAEFKFKKGYDIPIVGEPEEKMQQVPAPKKVAVLPQEFRGIKPKLLVREGDAVKRGTPVIADKQKMEIVLVAPVSGVVTEINRGERRMLLEVVIESDGKDEPEVKGPWSAEAIAKMSREEVVSALLGSGLWPYIIQRPFLKIADPEDVPRDIFISGMTTAPLGADPNFMLQGEEEFFQTGLDVLRKLTDGKIYLSLDGNGRKIAPAFEQAQGVEKNTFSGPHPAGNVGVHIHHIKPVRLGEKVWQIQPYAVALIGRFFKEGSYPNQRVVAVVGSSLKERSYFKAVTGTPISVLIPESNIVDPEVRFISGDVLTGRKTALRSCLSYYDHQITVIPEGKKERKLLGYFRPGLNQVSISRTFLSRWLYGNRKKFVMDTLANGAPRAFVMSDSDYEKVMPMDILPVPLAKSILAGDIEEMEGLGILELAEEDVALCSYICLSKTDFGNLLRQGLDLIEREEG